MNIRFNLPANRFWSRFALLAVLLVAFAVQFFRLDGRTLHGDEPRSVNEAWQLGLNATSLPYALLLRFWLAGGDGDFWLRSLSALLAVAAVAVTFVWARRCSEPSVAWLTALLLATSPFLVAYGQQVRFYTFGLLAACVSLWMLARLAARPGRGTVALWLLSLPAAVAALLLNGLLVVVQVTSLLIASPRPDRRTKLLLVGAALLLLAVLIVLPPARQILFVIVGRLTDAGISLNTVARGLSIANLAKVPLSFFFLTLGEAVHPLTFWLVIPAVLLFGGCLLAGIWSARLRPAVFWLALSSLLAPLLLFLVFDPLAPPSLQGAAPRYLIYLLPMLYLVIAFGAWYLAGRLRLGGWLLPMLLVAVNVLALGQYWYGDWSYTDNRTDWREITRWVTPYINAQTVVLTDGRSTAPVGRYFPAEWTRRTQYPYQTTADPAELNAFGRIIFISSDFHEEWRTQATALLEKLEPNFERTAVWSAYPLFIYVMTRKPAAEASYAVNANGVVNLPVEFYGLEFADLRLPAAGMYGGNAIPLTGGFALPLPQSGAVVSRTIRLSNAPVADRIILLSNMTGERTPAVGQTVALLDVRDERGIVQSYPLRAGYETARWDGGCQPAACQTAYTWHKRLALLGSERYAESWNDFTASIVDATLMLNAPARVTELVLRRVPSAGDLYIWGIILEPQ